MAQFIDDTKHSLIVHHPKFADACILERLTTAAERGVAVRVLSSGMHGVNDDDLLDTAAALRIMRSLGVKVHAVNHPRVHCKVIISDTKRALISSQNIARHAFEVRRELGVIVTENGALSRLLTTFEADWKESKRYDAPDPLEAVKNYQPLAAGEGDMAD